MKNKSFLILGLSVLLCATFSFKKNIDSDSYISDYNTKLSAFKKSQSVLLESIKQSDLSKENDREKIKQQIDQTRLALKSIDFWLRYLEPISYKKINSPLPVEWETEVFEKFEKPYKREGAGLILAALYLEEDTVKSDVLINLIQSSISATKIFSADSITAQLKDYHHFYLCNRLFLLNIAAIYTT
ncbi:MAG: cytochrome C peroxidase, partial [Bacteroidota bacterium]